MNQTFAAEKYHPQTFIEAGQCAISHLRGQLVSDPHVLEPVEVEAEVEHGVFAVTVHVAVDVVQVEMRLEEPSAHHITCRHMHYKIVIFAQGYYM